MRTRLLNALVFAGLSLALCCCGNKVSRSLDEIDGMLGDRPAEALARLDSIDPSTLSARLQAHHTLLRTIALAKNYVNDGSFVSEMEKAVKWYDRHGSRHDRLRSDYYYGDQLRGAGRLEEAAVRFMLSEEEAVRQEDWFIAGMSARSLYHIFVRTHNAPEQILSIKRAIDYFNRAGLEAHEDDARIKHAWARYNHSEQEVSDSLFNESIARAIQKKDTTRLIDALVGSVSGMLVFEPYRPDSAIARLAWAERLGYRPNYRSLADYAKAYSLAGQKNESKKYLQGAYKACVTMSESDYVSFVEYDIRLYESDFPGALGILQEVFTHQNNDAVQTLEQSVIKAQKNYLEIANRSLSQVNTRNRIIIILLVFLALSIVTTGFLVFKGQRERHEIEMTKAMNELDRHNIEADQYRFAAEELTALGINAFDKVGKAYYSAENDPKSVIDAYKSEIDKFQCKEFRDHFLEIVDKTHDGVITKIRSQVPTVSGSRLFFFALVTHGYSYSTISLIMGSRSRQNLYDMRKRLVRTIQRESPTDTSLFLGCLGSVEAGIRQKSDYRS